MYLLYRSRHLVSWLPAIVIAGCLLFVSQQAVLQVKSHYDDTAIELSLTEPEPPQPEPVPQPEPPPEPPHQPEPEPIAEPAVPAPEPIIQAKPVVKPKPRPKPKPVQDKAPKPQERVAPQPAVVRSPVSQPATPPAPPAPKANAQAVENGYLQVLRRELELRKRYPSGRQASLERPQGNVEVWLEVDRSGRVLASGIASKAPSMLLNRAALSALQSISQLKPFPEEAFAGQRSRKFTATFNYQAP